MVKFNFERIDRRNKQFFAYCQRSKKKSSTLAHRIAWELMTRGFIPDTPDEFLGIKKIALDRIFCDLGINSPERTLVNYENLQTYQEIVDYSQAHRKFPENETNKEYAQKIKRFFKTNF